MKVFTCKRQGGYAGGLIVVAANTKEEAFLTAARDSKIDWLFEWCDDNGGWMEDDGNIAHCYSEDYPFSAWKEEPLLTANVDKPQVIVEDGYAE